MQSTLTTVLPTRTISLVTEVEPLVGEDDAIHDLLKSRLVEAGIAVRPSGAPSAVPVRIVVRVVIDEGRTDGGGRYFAASCSAEIHVLRARLDIQGRHRVAQDRAAALAAAHDDLLMRIVEALTL